MDVLLDAIDVNTLKVILDAIVEGFLKIFLVGTVIGFTEVLTDVVGCVNVAFGAVV